MSQSTIELIYSFLEILNNSSAESLDNRVYKLAVKMDDVLNLKNSIQQQIPIQQFQQSLPIQQAKLEEKKIKSTARNTSLYPADFNLSLNNCASGTSLCSYTLVKGENKGNYCGACVTKDNYNNSCSINQQVCKKHNGKSSKEKALPHDNSLSVFQPSIQQQPFNTSIQQPFNTSIQQQPFQPSIQQPFNTSIQQPFNTFGQQPFNTSIQQPNFEQLQSSPINNLFTTSSELIIYDEAQFYFRYYNDQAYYFYPSVNKLAFILENSEYKLAGKIKNGVSNNNNPLPDNFTDLLDESEILSEQEQSFINNLIVL